MNLTLDLNQKEKRRVQKIVSMRDTLDRGKEKNLSDLELIKMFRIIEKVNHEISWLLKRILNG